MTALTAIRVDPIKLAGTSALRLGALEIRPATREVVWAGTVEIIEPRVMQVLVALAEAEGAVVSRDELVWRCWSGRIVGDNAIHRIMSRLRELGARLGGEAFEVQTINKVGYRLLIPPAGSAAPRAREAGAIAAHASIDAGSTPPLRRRIILWAAPALLTLAGFGGTLWMRNSASPSSAPISVFVESMRAPAGSSGLETFGSALASDVARLTLSGGVTVRVVDAADGKSGAGTALRLTGELQARSGDIEARLRLVDAANRDILWSTGAERPSSESAALREQLATRVADVLACAGEANAEAALDRPTLKLFLLGCEQRHFDASAALTTLRQVTDRAPSFAGGWSRRAMAASVTWGRTPEQERMLLDEARVSARRALSLNPKQGSAFIALAATYDGMAEWSRRWAFIQRAVAAEPASGGAASWIAGNLVSVGRTGEALLWAERARQADPFGPGHHANLAEMLAYSGSLAPARNVLADGFRRWPDEENLLRTSAEIEARVGDPSRALRALERQRLIASLSPATFATIAGLAQARLGQVSPADAAKALAKQAGSLSIVDRVDRLQALVILGDISGAYRLYQGIGVLPDYLQDIWFRTYMGEFRADPRFENVMRQQGVAEAWRRAEIWPDFCREERLRLCAGIRGKVKEGAAAGREGRAVFR